MKIVIIGAGALGSVLGAHLVRAGEDVTLIARAPRATLLQEHGITITGLGDFTVPVHVTAHPREVREADCLIVTVKTYDTEAALESVAHLRVGCVLSVQNGVVKDEQIAARFGWARTVGAAAFVSAEATAAGPVRFTVNQWLRVGELPAGTSERVEALAASLTRAGIRAEVSLQIRSVEWTKYVGVMSWMALAALTRLPTYTMFQDPDLARVAALVTGETAQVAAKLKIPLEDYEGFRIHSLSRASLEEATADFQQVGAMMQTQGATAHKVSILQDLERGRRLEVEETLGYAVRKGAELGLHLPTLETCYRLIKGIDRSGR